ncbi:porin family protein [Aureibacter tunicatorum]|uniref:Outer membrane protein beta-barrel domain-containing protein n=1 Tax=Aureibacter tunicatorum TaxID=866807 RepID=A0AAE3XL00_9BACT|nr:porin family protein [Aureibacter tunicatorum]MDR6237923.1 hypothetical protein [Aureibacter tunicatorum]BDD02956.1 hypothetical protein AUTU_04390 [Aureibacter tunicatorum]
MKRLLALIFFALIGFDSFSSNFLSNANNEIHKYRRRKQSSPSFELGFQGGYGVANVYLSEGSAKSRGVFHLGAIGQYNFNEKWAFVSKLHFDQKGYTYTDNTSGKESLTYVNLPMMGKFSFGNGVKGYLQAGFHVGYLLVARGENEGKKVDTKDMYNSLDFGLAIGLGVEFPLDKDTKMFFEWEANSGMANIANHPTHDIKVRNGASKLAVGVKFNIE